MLAKTPARKVPGCRRRRRRRANADGVGRENRVRRGEEITSRARRRVGTRARRRGTRGARRAGRVRRAGGVPRRRQRNGGRAHVAHRGAETNADATGVRTGHLRVRRTRGNVRTGTRLGTRSRRRGRDAMARDLAGRVCDDAAAEKRWPRALTASVATKIAPDAATTTKSKSRAFPAKTPNARGWSELDVANACAEACRALVRATIVGVDAELRDESVAHRHRVQTRTDRRRHP